MFGAVVRFELRRLFNSPWRAFFYLLVLGMLLAIVIIAPGRQSLLPELKMAGWALFPLLIFLANQDRQKRNSLTVLGVPYILSRPVSRMTALGGRLAAAGLIAAVVFGVPALVHIATADSILNVTAEVEGFANMEAFKAAGFDTEIDGERAAKYYDEWLAGKDPLHLFQDSLVHGVFSPTLIVLGIALLLFLMLFVGISDLVQVKYPRSRYWPLRLTGMLVFGGCFLGAFIGSQQEDWQLDVLIYTQPLLVFGVLLLALAYVLTTTSYGWLRDDL